jgi:hypothetical protein
MEQIGSDEDVSAQVTVGAARRMAMASREGRRMEISRSARVGVAGL